MFLAITTTSTTATTMFSLLTRWFNAPREDEILAREQVNDLSILIERMDNFMAEQKKFAEQMRIKDSLGRSHPSISELLSKRVAEKQELEAKLNAERAERESKSHCIPEQKGLPDRLKHWGPIIGEMDTEQLKELEQIVLNKILERKEQEKPV